MEKENLDHEYLGEDQDNDDDDLYILEIFLSLPKRTQSASYSSCIFHIELSINNYFLLAYR